MGYHCRSLLVSFIGSSILLSSFAQSQSVELCRQEVDDRARLACYDALFSPAPLTSAEDRVETVESTAAEMASNNSEGAAVEATAVAVAPVVNQVDAAKPAPVSVQSDVAATEEDISVDDAVAAKAQEAYDEVIANAQTLIVSDVRRNSRRQVFFATEQGRTFRRESGSYASFKEGDQLSIETGMMSSMFLVNQDGLRIKVKEL